MTRIAEPWEHEPDECLLCQALEEQAAIDAESALAGWDDRTVLLPQIPILRVAG